MANNLRFNGVLRILSWGVLMILIIGNAIWITQNLPYQGQISTAEVRRISRVDIHGSESSLHIFNGQIDCEQQTSRSILCQHSLGGNQLTISVDLQQSVNTVIFDCLASYGGRQLPCDAYESVYTHGGLATPVVILDKEAAQVIEEFETLKSRYSMRSIYNVQLWLLRVYQAFSVILFIQILVKVWHWFGNHENLGGRKMIQIAGTVASIFPAGIVIFYLTLAILVGLNLVS